VQATKSVNVPPRSIQICQGAGASIVDVLMGIYPVGKCKRVMYQSNNVDKLSIKS
jgi:hypothetical protein